MTTKFKIRICTNYATILLMILTNFLMKFHPKLANKKISKCIFYDTRNKYCARELIENVTT